VRTWGDLAVFYQAVRALYNRIFGILGLIMVVIVAFAMSNTLGMAVVERTREIGTLRAIGTQPGEVVRNFVLEGVAIGAAGATIGMLLAGLTTVALLFAGIDMPPPPGRSVGYPLLLSFSAPLYLPVPRWWSWSLAAPRRPGSSAAAPPTNQSRRPLPMLSQSQS
jgi:putative ABC transport system permease protein